VISFKFVLKAALFVVKRTISSVPTQGMAAQYEEGENRILYSSIIRLLVRGRSHWLALEIQKKKNGREKPSLGLCACPNICCTGSLQCRLCLRRTVVAPCPGASLRVPAQWASLSAPNLSALLWEGLVGRCWETTAMGITTLQSKQVSRPCKRRTHFNCRIQPCR